MKQNKFYKTSPHGYVGSTVMFHLINGNGYGSNLDEAEIFTRKDAQSCVDKGHIRTGNEQELFLSVRHVNDLSEWRVDCQHISRDDAYPSVKDCNDEYVAYKKQTWDGNDLGFCAEMSFSFDYSKARVFSEHEVNYFKHEQGYIFIAKSITDEVARRTFQSQNINRRKMISGAGVTGIRKPRERQSSGKERWNCPSCGRIIWQHHPYEFMGCSNIDCDEYKPFYERG